jgi:gentisate 1,2-dioxygenase
VSTQRTEELARKNYWQDLIRMRDEQREQRRSAIQVVRGDELPLENNAQGLMRWYMHPAIKDTVLTALMFFRQEIPPGGRSGRLKFQGGQVMYVTQGRGHTLIDGMKHAWEAGDILNLPLKREGLVIQHFNTHESETAIFVACEPNWFECLGVDRGSGFEQLEESPDYRAARAKGGA